METEKTEKTELDLFLEKRKERELRAEILNEPGRDLSKRFVKVGLFKVIGKKNNNGRWYFETDKEGIVIVDKSKPVVVTSNNGDEKQQTTLLPIEKIIQHNIAAVRGHGGASNPAYVLAKI